MKRLILSIQILSIISIGAFAGAMTMLYTALVSFWKQVPAGDFLHWFSNYSSGIETSTGPLVMLSLILPLISIFLVRKIPKSRMYWLISFLLCIGIMAITMSFFVGANTSFANGSIELDQVKETLNTWGKLHIVRISLAFISSIFAGIGLVNYMSETGNDKLKNE